MVAHSRGTILFIPNGASLASSSSPAQDEGESEHEQGEQGLLDALRVEPVFAVLYNMAEHISWCPGTSPAAGQYRSTGRTISLLP